MNTLRTVLALALCLALSGCFQTRTLVRLNADGSGTVEDTVLMNSAIQAAMMGGFGMGAASGMEQDEDTPYSMAELQARAEALGATFVSVEEQDILFGDGYVATYAFDDINTLALSSDFTSFLPEAMREEMAGEMDEQDQDEPIVFAFRNGELLVTLPQPDMTAMQDGEEILEADVVAAPMNGRDPKKQPAQDPGMGEMGDTSAAAGMAMLFKDMRFSVAVELPGEVARTNASFVTGRTLTLYDLNFDALAEAPESLDRLQEIAPDGPPSMAAAMRVLSEIPGFMYEPEETVTVTLR